MIVVIVCGLMLAAGLAAIGAWCRLDLRPPGEGSLGARYLWWVDLTVVTGILTGLCFGGAGGRLAMRLLAVTAGDDAQGRMTEAEQVVGAITVEGTGSLFVFGGLFSGLFVGGLYALLHHWLPRRWPGGLALGALLLVVVATRLEPLRPDNPDFGIVGPGWVAVLAFAGLVLGQAVAVAAVAARLSRSLPVLSGRRRTWPAYLPLLVLVPPVMPLLLVLVLGGLVVAGGSIPALQPALRSPRVVLAGRLVLGGVALVALPGFVRAIADIIPT